MVNEITSIAKQLPSGKNVINALLIADVLIKQYHCVSFNKTVYIYEDGIYKENRGEIEREIKQYVRMVGHDGAKGELNKDVINHILDEDPQREWPFNIYPDLIPVKNGVLHISYETGEILLKPHSHEYRFTYQLDVEYNKEALKQNVINLLLQWVDNRSVNILLQIPAQGLLQIQGKQPYKKSYLLSGETNAGKSTYLNFLSRLIHEENISNVSLQQIGVDRFCYAQMEGKIINLFDDLSDIPMENVGYFKNLTGRFDHSIEPKYKIAYKAKISCVHVFTCNKAPGVDGKVQNDSAFWDRWEYVEFVNYFPKDTTFEEKTFTATMMSSFLNAVIDMMCQIKKTNCLVSNTEPDDVKDMWNNSSDIVYKFIRSQMHPTKDRAVFDKGRLLRAIDKFARDELGETNVHRIPQTITALTQRIFGLGFEKGRGKDNQNVYLARFEWNDTSNYRDVKSPEGFFVSYYELANKKLEEKFPDMNEDQYLG